MCIIPIVKSGKGAEDKPRPQVGDIDIVIDEHKSEGYLYYILERFGNDIGFLADHFATLPDTPAEVIEETELVTA